MTAALIFALALQVAPPAINYMADLDITKLPNNEASSPAIPEHAWHCEIDTSYNLNTSGELTKLVIVDRVILDPNGGTYSRRIKGETSYTAYPARFFLFKDQLVAQIDGLDLTATVSRGKRAIEKYSWGDAVRISSGSCTDLVPVPIIYMKK